MAFRITGLDPSPFTPLYGLTDAELAARRITRYRADACPGFPDRVELQDVPVGQTVLLLNFTHQPAATPYHASHAIFVREGAQTRYDARDEIPPALRSRLLSLRAFDAQHMMIDAGVIEGEHLASEVTRLLDSEAVAYVQAHFAKRGCYAARIERG